jgi:hypothetical protein
MISLGLRENRCATCGAVGYGAGPCAGCDCLTCYDCAKAEPRLGCEGEFWFCPDCSASAEPPRFAWSQTMRTDP